MSTHFILFRYVFHTTLLQCNVLIKMTLHDTPVRTLDRLRVEQFRSFADATGYRRANSHHDTHVGQLIVEIRRAVLAVSYRHSSVREFTFTIAVARASEKRKKNVHFAFRPAAKLRLDCWAASGLRGSLCRR